MSKVDESVHLLLMEKFQLGLFENPYVDVDAAVKTIGKKEFQERGRPRHEEIHSATSKRGEYHPFKKTLKRFISRHICIKRMPLPRMFSSQKIIVGEWNLWTILQKQI